MRLYLGGVVLFGSVFGLFYLLAFALTGNSAYLWLSWPGVTFLAPLAIVVVDRWFL